ncbi:MAG: hypothetical protein NTW38_00605 [Candidatus Aminicenantes bacterium]|nr:hypothetical protein [Candidatus Aminicenantes bacterium]
MIVVLIFSGICLDAIKQGSIGELDSLLLIPPQIGFALALLNKKVFSRMLLWAFILVAGYFIISMLIGVAPSNVLVGRSANHVSTVMIFLGCLVYGRCADENKRFSLIPALIVFMLSVWALGRGGIIASGIILVGLFVSKRRRARFDYYFIGLGVIVVGIILFGDIRINFNLFHKSFSFEKFSSKSAIEDPRILILDQYKEKLNLKTVLLGFDRDALEEIFPLENMHNSFLAMHFRFGMFAFPIIGLMFYALVRSLSKNKCFFILLLAIYVRAFTDTILLPTGYFDFVFYFIYVRIMNSSRYLVLRKKITKNPKMPTLLPAGNQ